MTNKVAGCVTSRVKDERFHTSNVLDFELLDCHGKTPKQNTTGSVCETEHVKKNSKDGNDERRDNDEGKHCDNDQKKN